MSSQLITEPKPELNTLDTHKCTCRNASEIMEKYNVTKKLTLQTLDDIEIADPQCHVSQYKQCVVHDLKSQPGKDTNMCINMICTIIKT